MYRYDEFDDAFVRMRANQFKEQVMRRLKGEISEDEFKPLRLQNGVYLQLHAYMLRIAIPYGSLSATQMRALAMIADKYDRGYGHFTTRQNIQFNWPKLQDIPDILDDLADVQMHAIQTSGNCIRNVTSDPWAGVSKDEEIDPRPVCEMIRQWSSLNPEFAYLPRKFKFAITGAENDRAAIKFHDIGIRLKKNDLGDIGAEILIGGGQGRTPMQAVLINDFVKYGDLLRYLEACMRIYNLYGRRDNKYKARVKILIHEEGIDKIRDLINKEFEKIEKATGTVEQDELNRIAAYFALPSYDDNLTESIDYQHKISTHRPFANWVKHNISAHKISGHSIVNISLKPKGGIPGDATSEQMRAIADLADKYSFSEIRVTHGQNLVLPHVKTNDLYDVWQKLQEIGLAYDNIGMADDIICCPGLDYCGLATARSIPIAQNISLKIADLREKYDIGRLALNISGCINACGHHHVGHIGILGLEKKGVEYYQLTLGGNSGFDSSIGTITGPGFSGDNIVGAVETIILTYLDTRTNDEKFIDTYRRIGMDPFKKALYNNDNYHSEDGENAA